MKKLIITTCASLALFSGQALAQTCESDLIESTPSVRFIASDDNSEVFDTKTELVWRRCALGYIENNNSCIDDVENDKNKWNWLDVTRMELKSLRVDGWRLPNIKELTSITEYGCVSPAINTEVFYNSPADSGQYMSNTPAVNNAKKMKAVDIISGNIKDINKTNQSYYKVVRELNDEDTFLPEATAEI